MYADLLLAGGRVYTLGRAGLRPFSHLAVKSGMVADVGGEDLLGLKGPRTRVVRLAGAAVLPGFNDAHAHVVYHGLTSFGADLTGSRSIAELQRRLRAAAGRTPSGWVLGRGYWEEELAEKRAPHRTELDAAVGGRPTLVDHRGGHSRVASSAALAAGGITAATPDPPGGSIGRDLDGTPNGLLLEAAMRLPADHQPPPPLAQRKLGVRRCLRLLSSRGITSVGAAVNRGFADDLRAYQELVDEGRLEVRVNEFLSWELLPSLRGLGAATGFGSSRLRMGPVKVFVDGGASGATARLRGQDGPWRTTPEDLRELVHAAQPAGLQVAAHAIGDAAIEALLLAVESAPPGPRPLRHRVEHCTVCPPDLQRRLARAGMAAVMQPLFATLGRQRFGEQLPAALAAHVAPQRDLLRAGVQVAFSSDLPVVKDPNPWPGLAAAVGDGLTALQALRAYTVAGAWTTFEESLKGTLEPGRHADFQVYEEDPLQARPETWAEVRPNLVAVAGVPVARSRRLKEGVE